MSLFPTIILALGLIGTLVLGYFAFSGPSTSKAQLRPPREPARAAQQVDRGRGPGAAEAHPAEPQPRPRWTASPSGSSPSRPCSASGSQQTGRSWTLGQYASTSLGIIVVITLALALRGMPILLGLFAGLFVGIGLPAFHRRQADPAPHQQVQRALSRRARADGPRPALGPSDHRDDGRRRRRAARADRRGVPLRHRQDEDRPHDGGRAPGNRRPARHARNAVLRHHPRDPARDRRQPRRDARQPRRRAAQARRR